MITKVDVGPEVYAVIEPVMLRIAELLHGDGYNLEELKFLNKILSNPEWIALTNKFGADCIRIATDFVQQQASIKSVLSTPELVAFLQEGRRTVPTGIIRGAEYSVIKIEGKDYVATKLEGDAQ